MKCYVVAVFLLACGSSSSSSSGGAALDAQAPEGSAPSTCADVAKQLCTRAGTCATDGTAPLAVSATVIKYETVAYCESTLTTQCGPGASASDIPLIRDPARCGQNLASAVCVSGALPLPGACGGQ
jgi:hypothetical protein